MDFNKIIHRSWVTPGNASQINHLPVTRNFQPSMNDVFVTCGQDVCVAGTTLPRQRPALLPRLTDSTLLADTPNRHQRPHPLGGTAGKRRQAEHAAGFMHTSTEAVDSHHSRAIATL